MRPFRRPRLDPGPTRERWTIPLHGTSNQTGFPGPRAGTTVRCLTTFPDGDLLVATDHRLHVCVMPVGWQGPAVAVIGLRGQKPTRHRSTHEVRVIPAAGGPYLLDRLGDARRRLGFSVPRVAFGDMDLTCHELLGDPSPTTSG